MDYDVCGVILSGGNSRRFNSPKAFALYNQIPFWKHSLHALTDVTDIQIIVSHPDLLERFMGETNLSVIVDDHSVQGMGPMAGIYSALKYINAKWFVVLSCDIPIMERKVISELLSLRSENMKAIIPFIEGRVQPLVGIYHHSLLPLIGEQLKSGNYRLMSLLEKTDVRYVTEADLSVDPKVFQNINDVIALSNLIQFNKEH